MTRLRILRRPLHSKTRSALESTRKHRVTLRLRELQRPLHDKKRNAFGVGKHRDALQAARLLMAYDDEKTKILAEALTHRLLYDTMIAHMHDRRHGPLPRFMGRLRKTVGSFKDYIR